MDGPVLRVNVAGELLRLGYTLLGKIGEGATSEVFDARRRDDGRVVAVKISRPDVPEAPLVVARMQTEWNVGRGLRHPHLVSVFDGGVLSDGRAYLVMERLNGADLLQSLGPGERLEVGRALRITRQLCEALQVLHRRGAIHRDVKPENIYLCADGRQTDHVKLIDLGILALSEDDPERAHETTGQFIMGTPLYLAPEQATGETTDARTDLYALGGVLFHMLAGRPPFEGDDPTQIVSQHVEGAVEPLSRLAPGLPDDVYLLVHACLEKDRALRPANAAAVIGRIDDCLQDLAMMPADGGEPAELPALPPPGHQGDWLRALDAIERLVIGLWTPVTTPPGVLVALADASAARAQVEHAVSVADKARENADVSARERIEARERQARTARRIAAGLERARARQREAGAMVEARTRGLDAADDRYEHALAATQAPQGRLPEQVPLRDLLLQLHAVETFYLERVSASAGLKSARDEALAATEQLAALRAEELDLQRAMAEAELEEQDDGYRNEHAAAQADDDALAAVRGLEQASLRLMLECVRATQQG